MKDLKGAESVAEILTTDLRDYYDTDKIYINVLATDLNTYKIIIELFNEHDEIDFKWNIENSLNMNETIMASYINGIILDKFINKGGLL